MSECGLGGGAAARLGAELADLLAGLPGQPEIEGAANGLFLLQETYRLNVSEFSGGTARLPGSSHAHTALQPLTAEDCEFLR